MSAAADTAVIHLVRAGNDLDALSQFLASYESCPAGAAHRLIFLLKGFDGKLPQGVAALLDRTPHTRIYCPDRGYDIGSYFYVAERIEEPFVLFTNSFSVLQGSQWLSKFLNAYNRRGVGLVGATGSWQSRSSAFFNSRFTAVGPPACGLFSKGKALALWLPLRALFPAFPNVHIRTNGFLLARKDFLAMRPTLMRTKIDTWLFESGRRSLTMRVLRRGLSVLVVGRDGSVYRPEEWPRSGTYWQFKQENLLIQDNRTIAYEKGDANLQAQRCQSAWNCTTGR